MRSSIIHTYTSYTLNDEWRICIFSSRRDGSCAKKYRYECESEWAQKEHRTQKMLGAFALLFHGEISLPIHCLHKCELWACERRKTKMVWQAFHQKYFSKPKQISGVSSHISAMPCVFYGMEWCGWCELTVGSQQSAVSENTYRYIYTHISNIHQ